ncbi:MAG: serine hydrolase [Alphaproteobacteria bacterium]|nr:serine hydrolase [Alphaproteobacteria bacterium]
MTKNIVGRLWSRRPQTAKVAKSTTASLMMLFALPSFAHAQFSATNCTNNLALERRLAEIRERSGAPSLSASIFTTEGVRSAAVGVRNIETGDVARVGDLYRMGSLTKSVTGLIIGSMADEGLLSYDSTVAELLPQFVDQMSDGMRAITIGQLLNHSSGLPALDGAEEFERLFGNAGFLSSFDGSPVEQRRQMALHLLKLSPTNTPGSIERYSNGGYLLAGIIAETVTSQSWESLVQTRVARPLKIRLFTASPNDIAPDQPADHTFSEDGQLSVTRDFTLPQTVNPAGGLVASVEDWAVLQQAQMRGLLGGESELPISNATLTQLYTPSSPDGNFGYGGAIVEVDGRPLNGFVGSIGGVSYASHLIDEDAGVGTVLATNANGIPGYTTLEGILALDKLLADLAPVELASRGLPAPTSAGQAAVFHGLETLCSSDAGRNSELVKRSGEISKQDARALAEAIVPDDVRIAPQVALASMETVSRLFSLHIDQRHPDDDVRFAILYGVVDGGVGSIGQSVSADLSGHTTIFTMDWSPTDRVTTGYALAYGKTIGQLRNRVGEVEVDSLTLGAHIRYGQWAGLFAHGQALYAFQNLKTSRSIAAGAIDLGVASAKRNGKGVLLDTRVGYRISLGDHFGLSPFTGFQYGYVKTDKTSEKGSIASLKLDDQSYHGGYARSGIAADTTWDIGDWKISLTGKGLYAHRIAESSSTVDASFLEGPSGMSFSSVVPDKSWIEYETGLQLRYGRWQFSLGGLATSGRDDADNYSGYSKVGVSF